MGERITGALLIVVSVYLFMTQVLKVPNGKIVSDIAGVVTKSGSGGTSTTAG